MIVKMTIDHTNAPWLITTLESRYLHDDHDDDDHDDGDDDDDDGDGSHGDDDDQLYDCKDDQWSYWYRRTKDINHSAIINHHECHDSDFENNLLLTMQTFFTSSSLFSVWNCVGCELHACYPLSTECQ